MIICYKACIMYSPSSSRKSLHIYACKCLLFEFDGTHYFGPFECVWENNYARTHGLNKCDVRTKEAKIVKRKRKVCWEEYLSACIIKYNLPRKLAPVFWVPFSFSHSFLSSYIYLYYRWVQYWYTFMYINALVLEWLVGWCL